MSALRAAALVLLGLGCAGTASAAPKIEVGKLEGALKASVAKALKQSTSGKAELASYDDWKSAASRVGASPSDATAIRKIAQSIGATSVLYVTSGRDGRKWQVTVEVIDVSTQTIVKRWKVRSKKFTRVSH
ncbi:MAG: hypothetical protein RL846_27450, partial [Deltaproteobacteria bacterium]